MVNQKITIHKRGLNTRIKSIKGWKIPEEEKKYLLKFLNDLELGKVNLGTKISEARRVKYLDILKTPLTFLNKTMEELEVKDTENLEKALISDKIKSYTKKPYSHSTKVSIKTMLKIYLKYRIGDTDKFRKLVGWFDVKEKKRTPDYLKEEQIEKLYKSCNNSKDRFLVAVLFDSGCRAEEFMNIRYEDIELPQGSENYVKLTLKEEYSKTSGRTISLYWKYSLEAVKDFLKERELEGIKSNEPIFNYTYDSVRVLLSRKGEKILKRRVHFHLFRHSSATYYASKLNRQQLCYRFGWAFSSNMVDTYISRAGMNNQEIDTKMSSTKIEELETQLQRERAKRDLEREQMNQQLEEVKELLSEYANGKKGK